MPLPAIDCAMCFQPLDGNGQPTVPLECLHTFHEECMKKWQTPRDIDSNKAKNFVHEGEGDGEGLKASCWN